MRKTYNWEYWCLGVIVLILITAFSGVLGFRHKNDLFYNYKVTIIEKGGYAERNGKFTNVGKYFLIRSTSDTTLYSELNGLNFEPLGYYYGSPLFLSKNTGDTLTFKYIRKDRFYRLGGKK